MNLPDAQVWNRLDVRKAVQLAGPPDPAGNYVRVPDGSVKIQAQGVQTFPPRTVYRAVLLPGDGTSVSLEDNEFTGSIPILFGSTVTGAAVRVTSNTAAALVSMRLITREQAAELLRLPPPKTGAGAGGSGGWPDLWPLAIIALVVGTVWFVPRPRRR